MKKIIGIVLMIIVIVSFYQIFSQKEVTKSATIELPALKVAEYFGDTTKVSRWMVSFKDKSFVDGKLLNGQDTLHLLDRSMFDMRFKRSIGTSFFPFTFSIVPDKDSVNRSYILLTYQSSLWKEWTGGNMIRDARASLDSLQLYFNDPKRLYGYEVRGELVEDTSFLFSSRKIRRVDFVSETKRMYDMLIAQAEKREAGYNGVRIFHFIDNDSVYRTIYAGVGVLNRVETKPSDSVQYKMMPYQRNLLVLPYQGKYGKIGDAYTALEKYKADNRFVSMAIPFHKFLDPGYGFEEEEEVRVKVCYPVF